MIRIAAVGDTHIGRDSGAWLQDGLSGVAEHAQLLLLAGDLTHHGAREEGRLLANQLRDIRVPVVAVLGNHDYHQGQENMIRDDLEAVGVVVLEGQGVVLDVDGVRIGVGGSKGFGAGFPGACGTEFGEPEMKAFIRHGKLVAERLADALTRLDCQVRVALTHYAPAKGTLAGERLEIFPFLGSYHLGEAIDHARCDLAVHGHAHLGTEHGMTPGGVPVRNVARPVIRCPYKVYSVAPGRPATSVVALATPALGR